MAWTWRASEDMINDTLAQKIYRMTRLYDRAPKTSNNKTVGHSPAHEMENEKV